MFKTRNPVDNPVNNLSIIIDNLSKFLMKQIQLSTELTANNDLNFGQI